MAELHVIKTDTDGIKEDVVEAFEELRKRVESGECTGLAYAAILANGNHLTRASRSIDRRGLLGAILDLLFDVQDRTREPG